MSQNGQIHFKNLAANVMWVLSLLWLFIKFTWKNSGKSFGAKYLRMQPKKKLEKNFFFESMIAIVKMYDLDRVSTIF